MKPQVVIDWCDGNDRRRAVLAMRDSVLAGMDAELMAPVLLCSETRAAAIMAGSVTPSPEETLRIMTYARGVIAAMEEQAQDAAPMLHQFAVRGESILNSDRD